MNGHACATPSQYKTTAINIGLSRKHVKTAGVCGPCLKPRESNRLACSDFTTSSLPPFRREALSVAYQRSLLTVDPAFGDSSASPGARVTAIDTGVTILH